MNPLLATYFGYAASIFVVLSFALKTLKKIRIVNLIGCACFVIYAVYSGMLWPVIIPNLLICFIQIYHLVTEKKG